MKYQMTWEEAVCWLRQQPEQQQLVRWCYYDDPLEVAAHRFVQSEEWTAVRDLLPQLPGDVLDVGAGRGISSYAFAVAGWRTTALEPDPSAIVGAQAIRTLAFNAGLAVRVIEEQGEDLPFPDSSFDVVYGRQVLHHAADLTRLCKEVVRVLRRGGLFIATREHVISKPEDLKVFLENHPLHRFYGGEMAYTLDHYLTAFKTGGLLTRQVMGPFDSPINYFPMSKDEWKAMCLKSLTRFMGKRLAQRATREGWVVGRRLLSIVATRHSRQEGSPGRLYSFVMKKPL